MSDFKPNEEQMAAILAIDCNVSVSAGAGSGKTKVLVERFLHILEQGFSEYSSTGQLKLDAGNILAITFTRKAAGEMKERVRKSIEKRLEKDDDCFWHKQLESLNRAQISTIHGLCSRILRENPVEVRLDPAFVLAEEFTSVEFLEECLDKYLRRELREGRAATKKLIEVYGVSGLVRLVEDILPALEDILAELDLTKPYLDNINGLPQLKDDLCILVRDMVLNRKDLVGKTSKAGKALEQMAEVIEEICAGIKKEPADFSLLQQYLDLMQAKGGVKEYINAIKKQQGFIENVAVDKAALELLAYWHEFLVGLNSYVREQKQELDILNYDDLENYTVELLQRNAEVRHKYQERYRYIMVDEFQDTNDRQRQLIYLLCGDDAEKLEGQKLFVVGDPKQSIYRFRGADVSVFARVRREIGASGGKNLLLKTNYRTVDKILLAVNSAFRLLMGVDTEKDVYYEQLANHKTGAEVPQLLLVEYNKECGKSKSQVEAEAVAMAIEAYHEGCDYEGKQLLAPMVPYGKMAILLRAMTHSEALAAALQSRGIPYEIVDGKGFYECQEVLDLLNLLTVLANRFNSLELAGVLRSPYFGLDDETLTKLFLQKEACLWDALQGANAADFSEEQRPLVSRAARILQTLRKQATLLALPELWQGVWEQLAVDAVLSVQEHGANKLANVKKLRQLALEYSLQRNATLADWLDYVKRLRVAEARETTANLDAADAVQIMTIHKSKGLEFGTVFLPYLNSNTQPDTTEIKYLRGVGLGIKAPNPEGVLQNTNVLQKVKDEDKKLDLQERKRQLYVAMTRAEDRLIMTGVAEGKREKTLDELSWLKQLLQIYENDSVVEIKPLVARDKETKGLEQLSRAVISKEKLDNIAPLPAYAGNGPRAFSPSSLQVYLHCPRQYFYQYVMGLPPVEEEVLTDIAAEQAGAEQVGVEQNVAEQAGAEQVSAEQNVAEQAGMATDAADSTSTAQPAFTGSLSAGDLGSIVHRALELYKGDLDAALTQAIKENAPLYQGDGARRMLEGYLASDLYKRIPKKQLREQGFTLYAENDIVISGIIDCLAFNPDGSLLLVDYKTGKPPAADEVPEGYAYQLAIYEKVVRQRWGRDKDGKQRPLTAELHFLRNNSSWNLEAEQGQQAKNMAFNQAGEEATPQGQNATCASPKIDYYAAALKLCTEISSKSTEQDFPCREQGAIQAEQNHTIFQNDVTELEKNEENIAKGVALCSHCPYNYVCIHK